MRARQCPIGQFYVAPPSHHSRPGSWLFRWRFCGPRRRFRWKGPGRWSLVRFSGRGRFGGRGGFRGSCHSGIWRPAFPYSSQALGMLHWLSCSSWAHAVAAAEMTMFEMITIFFMGLLFPNRFSISRQSRMALPIHQGSLPARLFTTSDFFTFSTPQSRQGASFAAVDFRFGSDQMFMMVLSHAYSIKLVENILASIWHLEYNVHD